MRKLLLTLFLAGVFSAISISSSFARGHHGGGHGWPFFSFGFYDDPYYGYYYPPVVYAQPETTVVYTTPNVSVAAPPTAVPSGSLKEGRLYSPWSDFSMPVGKKSSGQTVYDPNTGQAFRVP